MSWRPHPGPQTDFMCRGEFEVLYGGAAGGGKTQMLILEALRYVDNPNYKALLIRRTFPRLQEIIDRCWQIYPLLGGTYRATEHRWYFPSKATITLGHMQHADDMYNYQGKEYHYFGVDEAAQFLKDQYLYLFSRCRSTDPSLPTRFRLTSNPGGVGHQWVKERFIDIATPGTPYIDPITGLSRCFIRASVRDNPSIMDNDPGYINRLNALPESERKRLLDGDWDIYEGQAFPELSKLAHGCEPFEIPYEWERYMVLDWGYAKPFAVAWLAVDHDGTLWMYREYYGCKDPRNHPDEGMRMTAQDVADEILRIEAGEKIGLRLADPSIWNQLAGMQNRRREAIGGSVADDMMKAGLFFLKADNDRRQGRQQIHKRLKLEPEIDMSTGELIGEKPGMFVFDACENFWRTMIDLLEDTDNPEEILDHQEDHIYDITRYACMHKPMLPKRIASIKQGTFQSARNKFLRAKEFAARRGCSLEEAYRRV